MQIPADVLDIVPNVPEFTTSEFQEDALYYIFRIAGTAGHPIRRPKHALFVLHEHALERHALHHVDWYGPHARYGSIHCRWQNCLHVPISSAVACRRLLSGQQVSMHSEDGVTCD